MAIKAKTLHPEGGEFLPAVAPPGGWSFEPAFRGS